MSKKGMLLIAPVVLGVPVLLWATLSARGERDPGRAPKAAARRPAPAVEGEIPADPPVVRTTPRPAGPVSPETAAILERVRKMEERTRDLQARRDQLAGDNKDLERQVTEKWAETSARSMAEWRVKSWESLLGLASAQKQSLVDLLTQWGKEDASRPAARDAWLDRETDFRSQFTADQAAKLHETAAAQAQQLWKMMGPSLGSMIGATRDEQARLQQSLGDIGFPQNMLLPEAYGADWNGLMREAAGRVRPVLTADQTAKLDKFGYK